MRDQEFTMENALHIQDIHLAEWNVVLNAKVYRELHAAVKKSNVGVTDPFKITRGQSLTNWVCNYSNAYSPF